MNRGLYAASVGMITQMNKMDVVSNNIANANTTGYKKDEVITRSFKDELYLRVNDENETGLPRSANSVGKLNLGNNIDMIITDYTSGSMQKTESPLDLAISGDGFFSVNFVDTDGTVSEKYTRDGSFTLGPNGELLTSDSFAVLDQDGSPIVLPSGSVPSISKDGSIYANDEFLTKIKITAFEDQSYLRKYGSNSYNLLDGATTKPFTGNVEQGYIEMSNVNSVKEMVDMITLSRAYEASSKALQAHDSIMQRTANDVGRK